MKTIHCSSCGKKITYDPKIVGKSGGLVVGIVAGGMIGARTGIAMGPFGAIAGTVPGALIGGLAGLFFGQQFDVIKCPECGKRIAV